MSQQSEETVPEDVFKEEEIKRRTQCDPSDHNTLIIVSSIPVDEPEP